jgi:hypothetical protein
MEGLFSALHISSLFALVSIVEGSGAASAELPFLLFRKVTTYGLCRGSPIFRGISTVEVSQLGMRALGAAHKQGLARLASTCSPINGSFRSFFSGLISGSL